MDNIQNWIYLILGVIYFLSKLRKKSKLATPETRDKESTRSKKIKTFEELLGEFNHTTECVTDHLNFWKFYLLLNLSNSMITLICDI